MASLVEPQGQPKQLRQLGCPRYTCAMNEEHLNLWFLPMPYHSKYTQLTPPESQADQGRKSSAGSQKAEQTCMVRGQLSAACPAVLTLEPSPSLLFQVGNK
jgi:hypothetical protein